MRRMNPTVKKDRIGVFLMLGGSVAASVFATADQFAWRGSVAATWCIVGVSVFLAIAVGAFLWMLARIVIAWWISGYDEW